MPDNATNDITVENLHVQLGETLVLDDVDLDVEHGKITTIMGPSGCGKSTLLKSILGMVSPIKGNIHILGRDVVRCEREELSKFLTSVGVTFQHSALFGSETVGENVAMPLREHTTYSEEIIQSIVRVKLALVDLAHAAHRMPSELSGGMQKRASIARALVMDPPILLFDEPSAGLDPITGRKLDDLILSLNQSLDCTIVVVTHEMHSAMRISDDLVYLDGGKIQETGTPDTFRHSSNPAV
ncbi:MAG: ABC transporter ATP-binding protein, partial [Planctomycetota bacterium]